MPKKQIMVVAAIFQRGDKYLITQRLENTRYLPLKWEFPGGKVEFGEDPRDTLKREIAEELGIEIHVFESIKAYASFVYDNEMHIILLAFSCYFDAGLQSIRKIGIKDYKWVTPNQMSRYDFCEADIPLVKKLQEEG